MSFVVAKGSVADLSHASLPSPCECHASPHHANVAAYLDAELNDTETRAFESHLKTCAACARSLNEQKRVLCALDAAFNDSSSRHDRALLPKDFTRTLIARAETDMRGVRGKSEWRRAVVFAFILLACASTLLGAANVSKLFSVANSSTRAAIGLMWTMLGAMADACAGLFVVLRALNHRFIVEAQPHVALALLMLLLCLLTALLILRSGGLSSSRSE